MNDKKEIQALFASLPSPPTLIRRGGDDHTLVASIVCDSRQATPDSMFVCIRGEQADGHRYVPDAIARGCRLLLVEAMPDTQLPDDVTVWQTTDTRRDLALLCAAFYDHPARELTVVGITGTKGKTTTAMLCYHILLKHGIKVGYIGTNGIQYQDVREKTQNTTPASPVLQHTLRRMRDAGISVVLLEISSQAVWQKRVDGTPLSIAAFTNLYSDHIGAPEHPDFDHYKACKKRVLTDYGAGLIIANADDHHTSDMLRGIPKSTVTQTYSCQKKATLRAENIQTDSLLAMQFCCYIDGQAFDVHLPLVGEYNASNALCALMIAHALGVPLSCGADYLADAVVDGRFEVLQKANGGRIVIDYAHNGAALQAVLTALRAQGPGRLILILGSVGGRTACRRKELGQVAAAMADFTYITADNPDFEDVESICHAIAAEFSKSNVKQRYRIIPDRETAVTMAVRELGPDDILLIAGKGNENYQRIRGVDVPYSDRQVVQHCLADSDQILEAL